MTDLVKNISDLKRHIALDFIEGNEGFAVLQPMIEDREMKLKSDYTGRALWAKLKEKYEQMNASSSSSSASASGSSSSESASESTLQEDKMAQVLWFAQRIVCNFALMDYIPEGQLDISANGIRITVNETKKTAFEWQISKLEKKYSDTAHLNIELMLQYLNQNIDEFTEWTSSKAYVANKGRFINSAMDFQKFVDIDNSHLTFLKLLPVIDRVEDNQIRSAIGNGLYEELKERIKDGEDVDSSSSTSTSQSDSTSQDEQYDELFRLIRAAVAYFVAAEAGELLKTDQEKSEKNAYAYMHRLAEYLNNNASVTLFKKYYDSSKYTAPEGSVSFTSGGGIDNSGFTGVYGAF